MAEWGSFIIGLLSFALALGTVLGGFLIRAWRRVHRRLESIEELAADAYNEAGLARSMIEGRRRAGGRRSWDPEESPWPARPWGPHDER